MSTRVKSTAEREKIIARVINSLDKMPKAKAAVEASALYSKTGLKEVTDARLKSELCVRLADYFKDTTARGLVYWETFR